jgi:hypothetical protein
MLPVTVQAPAHFDLLFSGDPRHSCHVSVTLGARATCANMHHVWKIDKVRHPVNPDPGDRLLVFPVRHELFYFRSILGDEQVAGPAISHCRDAGNRGPGSVAMTEEARDGVVPCMDFMTEGDRLEWSAALVIQRQNVHKRQSGGKNSSNSDQRPDKP